MSIKSGKVLTAAKSSTSIAVLMVKKLYAKLKIQTFKKVGKAHCHSRFMKKYITSQSTDFNEFQN